MTTTAATTDTLDELHTTEGRTRRELFHMRTINAAFKAGLPVFLQHGYSEIEYYRFADAMRRNPEYGPDPFPASLVQNKAADLRRLEQTIHIGNQFLRDEKEPSHEA